MMTKFRTLVDVTVFLSRVKSNSNPLASPVGSETTR